MFSVGDAIVYGSIGVCTIKDITVMYLGGVEKEYYILSPNSDPKSTIYVPLDSEALVSQMKPVLSKDEIAELLSHVGNNNIDWIVSNSERKAYCRSAIKNGDRTVLIALIRMLYTKREEYRSEKKHFHVADEKALAEACKLIHDEFSYVLGISSNEVPDYIEKIVKS